MTHSLRTPRVAGALLVAGLALPASALAQGHGDRGNAIPARVKQRVAAVSSAAVPAAQ